MPSTAEERKAAWDTLVGKLGEIDSELKMLGTPFFGGQSPNMTDYMIWPWIERLPIMVRRIAKVAGRDSDWISSLRT